MLHRPALPLLLVLASCADLNMTAYRDACTAANADACEIVAARLLLGADESGAASFDKRAHDLRLKACNAGDKDACQKLAARGTAASVPLPPPPAPPPAGVAALQPVLKIDVYLDGRLVANDVLLAGDDALLARAREELAKSPDLRAVIRADTAVTHGRVIHVMDLLKQAGISKIAFGVALAAPAPSAPSPP